MEDPCVNAKQMVSMQYLNEPKYESNVCPLQVWMVQCQRYPEIATITLKYLMAPVSPCKQE